LGHLFNGYGTAHVRRDLRRTAHGRVPANA